MTRSRLLTALNAELQEARMHSQTRVRIRKFFVKVLDRADHPEDDLPPPEKIIETMVAATNIPFKKMASNGRQTENVVARMICMYLLREKYGYGMSMKQIGEHFGRHYTTVINAIKTVRNHIETGDPMTVGILERYKELEKQTHV